MAKGGKCPQCGHYLFLCDEKWEPKDTTVWYGCANRKCRYPIKKFIPSGK
jgi:hypothetical protein